MERLPESALMADGGPLNPLPMTSEHIYRNFPLTAASEGPKMPSNLRRMEDFGIANQDFQGSEKN
jgi:hypothetical protein